MYIHFLHYYVRTKHFYKNLYVQPPLQIHAQKHNMKRFFKCGKRSDCALCSPSVACKKVKLFMKDGSLEDWWFTRRSPTVREVCKGTMRKAYCAYCQLQPLKKSYFVLFRFALYWEGIFLFSKNFYSFSYFSGLIFFLYFFLFRCSTINFLLFCKCFGHPQKDFFVEISPLPHSHLSTDNVKNKLFHNNFKKQRK